MRCSFFCGKCVLKKNTSLSLSSNSTPFPLSSCVSCPFRFAVEQRKRKAEKSKKIKRRQWASQSRPFVGFLKDMQQQIGSRRRGTTKKTNKKTKQNKRRTERIAVSILNCPRQKPMACDAVVWFRRRFPPGMSKKKEKKRKKNLRSSFVSLGFRGVATPGDVRSRRRRIDPPLGSWPTS